MTPDEALAKLELATNDALEKKKARILLAERALKLFKDWQSAAFSLSVSESRKLMEIWKPVQQDADNAEAMSIQADKAEQLALEQYDTARFVSGG